jgi:hypothetical protein
MLTPEIEGTLSIRSPAESFLRAGPDPVRKMRFSLPREKKSDHSRLAPLEAAAIDR